jgi:DNA-binding GntR family transcriptional regulator
MRSVSVPIKPKSTKLKPVKTDMIAATLRDEILGGRLSAGQRMTEVELAQRFGASRAAVRPAIQQLAMQGLLVCKTNCGAAVAPEAPKAIRDLIVPIRRTVEAYALRLIFSDLTSENYQAWEEILAKMKAACARQNVHTVAECDLAFHRTIVQITAQRDLLAIWETLVGRVRSHFRRTQRQLARLTDIYDEHCELLEVFRGTDEEAAVRLLTAKIE